MTVQLSDTLRINYFSTIPVVAQPMSGGGLVKQPMSRVVIIRIKAISLQLNLPTGTELGSNTAKLDITDPLPIG